MAIDRIRYHICTFWHSTRELPGAITIYHIHKQSLPAPSLRERANVAMYADDTAVYMSSTNFCSSKQGGTTYFRLGY